ncbi:hypothetical protein B0H13DRAFT_2332942 [Mycena leptocephala]|nr:hypothetical protein B0H13DRAFT_2332942 [Mycena leptocephala]
MGVKSKLRRLIRQPINTATAAISFFSHLNFACATGPMSRRQHLVLRSPPMSRCCIADAGDLPGRFGAPSDCITTPNASPLHSARRVAARRSMHWGRESRGVVVRRATRGWGMIAHTSFRKLPIFPGPGNTSTSAWPERSAGGMRILSCYGEERRALGLSVDALPHSAVPKHLLRWQR